jgi:catechol-2,3-dioxygenase
MGIQRIESVLYGVEDLELCRRFFEDVGLELVEAGTTGVSFRTPVNQFVHLRRANDPALPPAMESGSTLREVVWGVDSPEALETVAAALSKDRPVSRDSADTVRSSDQSGLCLAFMVARPAVAPLEQRSSNVADIIGRRNRGFEPYTRAHPLRIIHVAIDIPKAGHLEANQFYTQRLKFRPIDTVRPMGTFMQCEGDIEHHNFLLCHRPDRLGVNHIALEVRDFDEVVEGGNYMTSCGWKESRRLGRHNLGSNVFRMFHAPCGGRIEYAADMDRMDKSFEPRTWQETPPHHLWMVKFPGDTEH